VIPLRRAPAPKSCAFFNGLLGAEPPALYAASLRIRRQGKKPPLLDAWYFPLALGQPLPTIPIWLGPGLLIRLPLEPSYKEVCRLLRIA